MSRVRSFVAARISDAARNELAALIGSLRASGADVKWVSPENLHITLKFLGDVDFASLEGLGRALGQAGRGQASFGVRLEGVGAFPSMCRPRVVWAGVGEGAGPLVSLAGAVEKALAEAGYPRETKRFSAHVTLGRCRGGRGLEDLKKTLASLASFRGTGFDVSEIVLFSSDLHPTGPVYTPLSTFALKVGGPNQEGGGSDG